MRQAILVGLPRQDTRQPIVGLESKLPDAPLIGPDHSQHGEGLWRERVIACLGQRLF